MIRDLVSSVLNLGVEPGDGPEVRTQKAILSASGISASLALIFLIGPVYFYFDEPVA